MTSQDYVRLGTYAVIITTIAALVVLALTHADPAGTVTSIVLGLVGPIVQGLLNAHAVSITATRLDSHTELPGHTNTVSVDREHF